MKRYPRITVDIISESLGYATPSTAARIGLDGLHGRENSMLEVKENDFETS